MLLRHLCHGLPESEQKRVQERVGRAALLVGMGLNSSALVLGRAMKTATHASDFWQGFMIGLGCTLVLASIPLVLWNRSSWSR